MAGPSYYDCFQRADAVQPVRALRNGADFLLPTICPAHLDNFPLLGISACGAGDNKLGVMCRLPESVDPVSIIHQQDHVNAGAFGHPSIPIVESMAANGVRYLFCCPVTSLGNTKITQKYARCRNEYFLHSVLNSWMPIAGNGRDDGPLAKAILHEELEMENGRVNAKKSYVGLAGGYWIEEALLPVWGRVERKLTAASLNALQWAYGVAQNYRLFVGEPARVGSPIPSPAAIVPQQEYMFSAVEAYSSTPPILEGCYLDGTPMTPPRSISPALSDDTTDWRMPAPWQTGQYFHGGAAAFVPGQGAY